MFSPIREDQTTLDPFALSPNEAIFTDAMLHSLQLGVALWFQL
jgi:hypothetical protein